MTSTARHHDRTTGRFPNGRALRLGSACLTLALLLAAAVLAAAAFPAFGAAPAPTISGYAATNPRGVRIASAPPGAPLLIEGANLGSSGTVAFGGFPAPPPASWSDSEILVMVPTASSYPFTGPVTVTTNGQTARGPAFTITPPTAPVGTIEVAPLSVMWRQVTDTKFSAPDPTHPLEVTGNPKLPDGSPVIPNVSPDFAPGEVVIHLGLTTSAAEELLGPTWSLSVVSLQAAAKESGVTKTYPYLIVPKVVDDNLEIRILLLLPKDVKSEVFTVSFWITPSDTLLPAAVVNNLRVELSRP